MKALMCDGYRARTIMLDRGSGDLLIARRAVALPLELMCYFKYVLYAAIDADQ